MLTRTSFCALRAIACNSTRCHGLNLAPRVTLPLVNQCRRYTSEPFVNEPNQSLRTIQTRGFFSQLTSKFQTAKTSKLRALGVLLYEDVANNFNYVLIVNKYSLPDTFYTWFTITELHIWMLAARLMAEGDDGKTVRNKMIEMLWTDVRIRSSKLEHVSSVDTKEQIVILQEQFQAALIGYDEGLTSDDDKILAGIIWRRLFQSNADEAQHVEDFVKFVRVQMSVLDNVTFEEIRSKHKIPWKSQQILLKVTNP